MTSFSTSPKPLYVYNSSDDTWYEVSAKADTASGYEWAGDHTFLAAIIGKHGINNFLNPTARDSAIPSPIRGAFCIIKQDSVGNNINQFQIHDGTQWTSPIIDSQIMRIMGAD